MRPCQLCGERMATDRHHLLSQTKLNRKLYPEFIDDSKNTMYLCSVCHLNKSIPKYNERQFCEMFGIEPRSKSGRRL